MEVLKGLMALPPETQAALMQLVSTPNLAAAPKLEVRIRFCHVLRLVLGVVRLMTLSLLCCRTLFRLKVSAWGWLPQLF